MLSLCNEQRLNKLEKQKADLHGFFYEKRNTLPYLLLKDLNHKQTEPTVFYHVSYQQRQARRKMKQMILFTED